MKYCSKCGSQINDDAVFCAGCGTRVSDNNTNQNAENLQPTAEQTTNEENPNVTNTVPLQQQSVYAQGIKQKKNVGLYEKYSFFVECCNFIKFVINLYFLCFDC